MATKKSAVKTTAKKAGKAANARKTATKPAKKAAPAKKPVKKASKPAKTAAKPAPKAKTQKVTARRATGKMVRQMAKPARPVKAKTAGKPAKVAKPSRPAPKVAQVAPTAVKARRPEPKPAKAKAAPAAAKAVVKAPSPPRPSRPRLEERKALPHKEPARPVMSLNDYFDMNASPYPTLPPSRREVLPVAVEWKEKMRPGELYQAFKRFFEANEIGNRLIGPLREQAAAIVEFEGDPQIYKIVKVRGRAVFEHGRPASAEVYVKFSRFAVEAILAPNATKPSEYVERFCQLAAESDPVKRIEFKLLCTQGEAIRKGYLGIIASGGKQLVDMLAPMGYSLPQDFVRQLK